MDSDTSPRLPIPPGATPETSPVTRRRFLQAAGILGAGLTLAPGAIAQSDADRSASDAHSGPPSSPFDVRFDAGAIVSLKYAHDTVNTEYIAPRGRLGDVIVRHRPAGHDAPWQTTD